MHRRVDDVDRDDDGIRGGRGGAGARWRIGELVRAARQDAWNVANVGAEAEQPLHVAAVVAQELVVAGDGLAGDELDSVVARVGKANDDLRRALLEVLDADLDVEVGVGLWRRDCRAAGGGNGQQAQREKDGWPSGLCGLPCHVSKAFRTVMNAHNNPLLTTAGGHAPPAQLTG